LFFTFLFYWVIAFFIFANENRTKHDVWAACAFFVFGVGGISVVFREQADKGNLGWIFPAVAGSIAMLWGPYTLLMFSFYYLDMMPKSRGRRVLVALLAALPLISFYFAVPALQMFGHAEPQAMQDIHLRIMTALVAPYYLGTAFLITRNLLFGGELNKQTENFTTFLIGVPPTLLYYIFAYIIPCFGALNSWKASLPIMITASIIFVYFVINKNAFGLSFKQHNATRKKITRIGKEGTNILQDSMQNNLLATEIALHNAYNNYSNNPEELDLVMNDIQSALGSCEQALSLLERIHSKTHPEQLKPELCYIFPIIEQVINQIQTKYSEKKVNIVTHLEPNLQLICDPVHLKEAIQNLANNAIEAVNSDGSGSLVISVTKTKNKLVISIRDNGCGINVQQSKRLGMPWFTSKDEGEHYGLGLYYVKKVIEMHKGQFALRRPMSGGMIAEIILPYKQ